MRIEEAMGILAAKRLDDLARNAFRSAEACQLGIEALKSKLEDRKYGLLSSAILLPGETKE